jgi:hypothetical protein
MGNVCESICGGGKPYVPLPAIAPEHEALFYNNVEPERPPALPTVVEEPTQPPPPPEEPKPPPKPAPTTPIVLETLQGEWVNSVGAKIKVEGSQVFLNGIPLAAHPLTFHEDGTTIKSIGKIWQLKGWMEDEKIEWKEAPSLEVAEFARSVVWTKATVEKMIEWNAQMKGLGYAGSSSAPLSRGVEGCCPGTCDAKAKIFENSADQDKEELALLNRLVTEFRLPGLRKVPPALVVPDFSNRGQTGLSVEHVHYLAKSFRERGFIERQGDKGHDIPVLVEESTSTDLGKKSIENWRSRLAEEPGFPPKEHYEKLFGGDGTMYCSLGNGHFNQALNLFANECKDIYGEHRYQVGNDRKLKDAIENGVHAIILRKQIPLRDREIISKLLNSKREYKWSVHADGTVDISDSKEDTKQVKQFEAMSKVLDAVELNCLVRAELGVKDSHRIGQ